MAADWLKIRNDYINGGGSYRGLAAKYGVPFGTLREKAKDENWVQLREEQQHNISTVTAQKTIEKTSDAISDEAATKVRIRNRIFYLAEGYLSKIEEIEDTADFRRIVQCCVDMGVAEDSAQKNDVEDLSALADLLKI